MQFETANGAISVTIAERAQFDATIASKLQENQGFALATLNLDHLVKMNKDQSYLQTYRAQDLVVADGNPIVWMSRVAQSPVALMPGSELVIPLAQMAAQAGRSVALLGSTDEALQAAADHMKSVVPGLQIACTIAPPFGFDPNGDEAAQMLAEVQASGAGICFLALGAPKQEQLAARGRALAPNVGFASIGAGLDFLAGTQHRAPRWVQQLALEWLWRLMANPRRMWGRYVSCMAILPGHMLRSVKARRP